MQTLARVPFFKDSELDFEKFDRRCAWKRYDEGEIVVDFEDFAHPMCTSSSPETSAS